MDPYLAANQALWDMWTSYHVTSPFYDVPGFKAGRDSLDPITLAGPGDVRGKSLLHLQCHFGLDTLSWARRGATVTGVDFSERAITAARALATELHLPATFVHSNLYDLPQHLTGHFDVVFTSYGVLGWLPDLEGWAQVIAHFLKRGIFYIVEAHPFALLFDERRDDAQLRLRESYFRSPEPLREEEQGSYAVPAAPVQSVSYVWLHRLADIIGSLLRAGLRLVSFEEYPFMSWPFFPWMERRADGMWQLPSGQGDIPLMSSLQATKPEGERGHRGESHV
jgi:SAM-dependent methyltransferase